MKLSVIIPTHNRREILLRCIDTLSRQTLNSEDFEVVVVIDGSTDGTKAALLQCHPGFRFRFVEQPSRGPAVARNAGVRHSTGEILVFLDDDMVCDANLLQEHLAAHSGDSTCLVQGRLELSPDSPWSLASDSTRIWYEDYNIRIARGSGLRLPKDVFLISNSSISRVLFDSMGGFDENTLYPREDFEFGIRLWKKGVRFKFQPKSLAYEYYSKSSTDVVERDAEGIGRTEEVLCRKYPEYRPFCALTSLGRGGPLKQELHALALAYEHVLNPLLGLLISGCETLPQLSVARRIGHRLLAIRYHSRLQRIAAEKCGSLRLLKARFGQRVPCLMYHHVGPYKPGTHRVLTIEPMAFKRQMRWLARHGYTGIRSSDWLGWVQGQSELPKRPVILTFDDAYYDIAEHALPILESYGFGSTVFVVTQRIGATNTWDESQGIGTHRLMTLEQIRNWSSRGIEFGAHGRTHRDLRTLGPSELNTEISGSSSDLNDLLGFRPTSFAYPYGYFDSVVSDAVRTHFNLAFSVEQGLNQLGTDPMSLLRSIVEPDDTELDYLWRLRFGNCWPLRLRKGIKRRLASHLRLAH